jgi:2'-5' RNA ligase
MRCFVAVEIPPEVKAAMAEAVQPLKPLLAGARWVRPEAMHVTLKFLGEIDAGQAAKLGEGLLPVAHRPAFSVRFRGIGAFPRGSSARVLWAGVRDGAEALTELATAVMAVTDAHGAGERESKQYVPHVTLARFRAPCDLDRIEVFGRARETEMGVCRVDRLVLLRSHLRPDGAVYEPLCAHELRAGGS